MNREHLIRRYEHNYFRGWVVSTKRRGKRFTRYFSDQPHGRAAALRAARAFRVVRRSCVNTRLDVGKANLQLIANEENQDRAECGKNETGGMISFVCRTRKHVGYGAADD